MARLLFDKLVVDATGVFAEERTGMADPPSAGGLNPVPLLPYITAIRDMEVRSNDVRVVHGSESQRDHVIYVYILLSVNLGSLLIFSYVVVCVAKTIRRHYHRQIP